MTMNDICIKISFLILIQDYKIMDYRIDIILHITFKYFVVLNITLIYIYCMLYIIDNIYYIILYCIYIILYYIVHISYYSVYILYY